MKRVLDLFRDNFSYLFLGGFLLFALFNPIFKKFDYGAGYPLVLVLGVIVFVIGIREMCRKREKAPFEKVFLIIFALSIVISFILSKTRNLGFSEVLAFESVILLYLILAHKKIKWWRPFLNIIAASAVLAVFFGYFLYFVRPEVRMFGPFFNNLYHSNVWPNAFALFLLMVWPVIAIIFRKKWGIKVAILLGIIFSGILLTFSRGAFLVLMGQLFLSLVYFLYSKKIKTRCILLVILMLLVAGGLFYGANSLRALKHDVVDVKERITFENSEGLTSKQERIDFWNGAIILTKQKPYFGWGPFSFRQAYNPYQKTFLGSSDHPHNIFLKIAAENGLIALVAFIGFLLTLFITVVRRFSSLTKEKRFAVYFMGVSIIGAFVHNLIDYNFNFIVNLLILFLMLIFVRNLVIRRETIKCPNIWAVTLSFFLFILCIFEGVILFLDHSSQNSKAMEYSFYPRNYYLEQAEEALFLKNFERMNSYLDEHLMLNPLDSRAYYLKGVAACSETNENHNHLKGAGFFLRALQLDPKNEWIYYRDYMRSLIRSNSTLEVIYLMDRSLPLLYDYFVYVENNVHFTAYTANVEAAAELIEIIAELVEETDAEALLKAREQMLETADRLRKEKTF